MYALHVVPFGTPELARWPQGYDVITIHMNAFSFPDLCPVLTRVLPVRLWVPRQRIVGADCRKFFRLNVSVCGLWGENWGVEAESRRSANDLHRAAPAQRIYRKDLEHHDYILQVL